MSGLPSATLGIAWQWWTRDATPRVPPPTTRLCKHTHTHKGPAAEQAGDKCLGGRSSPPKSPVMVIERFRQLGSPGLGLALAPLSFRQWYSDSPSPGMSAMAATATARPWWKVVKGQRKAVKGGERRRKAVLQQPKLKLRSATASASKRERKTASIVESQRNGGQRAEERPKRLDRWQRKAANGQRWFRAASSRVSDCGGHSVGLNPPAVLTPAPGTPNQVTANTKHKKHKKPPGRRMF